MKKLALNIYRQRLIIEGFPGKHIGPKRIKKYLLGLSKVLKMKPLIEPVTHKSHAWGWAGWIHWATSGCHFYEWDRPRLFFSVDIYTCKKFSVKEAVRFTKEFFKTKEITYKSV